MKLSCAMVTLAVVALTLVSLGCGTSSQGTRLRFMDASPDESSLTLLVDGTADASSTSYGTASGYTSVSSGSHHLQVEIPSTTSILVDQTSSFNSITDSTVVATGFSSSMAGPVFLDDNSAPTSGNVKVRIINATPGLGTADVYIVAPGTNIATVSATISNLPFQVASSYQSIPAGNYEVFFTLPGQKFAYIDSGAQALAAGQIRTVVGLNSPSGGFTSAILADLN